MLEGSGCGLVEWVSEATKGAESRLRAGFRWLLVGYRFQLIRLFCWSSVGPFGKNGALREGGTMGRPLAPLESGFGGGGRESAWNPIRL